MNFKLLLMFVSTLNDTQKQKVNKITFFFEMHKKSSVFHNRLPFAQIIVNLIIMIFESD